MTESLTFSIVINTLNRVGLLRETLASLNGLTGHTFEVVVVNGPSTDGTSEFLKGWTNRVKLRQCDEANLSMSRNIGLSAAAGDIVAFIDDDAIPHSDWLIELSRPYTDPKVAAVGGFTIDNTGTRFQARKTICDRYGDAQYVSELFDERTICFPKSPFYPSLLGTNSSFRRASVLAIGGFDHVFAYFLDETDVCLRLVDAGFHVRYAPSALVFHQFAASHVRDSRSIPRTLYPSAVSKSYFIMHHGARADLSEASRKLDAYRAEILGSNAWLCEHSEISPAHRSSLDQDLGWGIEEGTKLAMMGLEKAKGDLDASEAPPFHPFDRGHALRIVLVSQSFPPANDAGIARWSSLLALGLARRGHVIHVVTRAESEAWTRFKDGIWIHAIKADEGMDLLYESGLDLPPNIAAWAGAVRREIASLATFGLDIVSFPIWDVEGIALPEVNDFVVAMSLHTTYALAKPFKPEWNARPLYEHFTVDRMIALERDLLCKSTVILANSNAIVADIEDAYKISIGNRVHVVPHGTPDPFAEKPGRRDLRSARRGRFQVAFVGRFERRKGFDIAAAAVARLLEAVPTASAMFVGDEVTESTRRTFEEAGARGLLNNPQVAFLGQISRDGLDDVYATCDVVIMPSRYESFGLVAIEAMAGGAAVVAVRAGGLAEVVVHNQTGYLVPLDGKESETCGDYLLALAKSPETCRSLGESARRLFEAKYSVERMIEGIDSMYQTAIANRSKANVAHG